MIEKLSSAAKVLGPFGPVTATHRGWGHTYQPWNTPALTSYSVLGVMVDGAFKPIPGTEETIQHEKAPSEVSQKSVVALHRRELARREKAEEEAEAESEEPARPAPSRRK